VVKNKREYEKGVSSGLRGTAKLKPREAKVVWNRQEIGAGLESVENVHGYGS